MIWKGIDYEKKRWKEANVYMSGKNSVYITTTLPYVNAEPHIGFALEIVHADIIARYKRLIGIDVFFNTGTDEHGQKILAKAIEEGKEVQEYVDHYAEQFKKLKETLGLSTDAFIRTTDPHHVAAAEELWRRCAEAGDIYKKKYKGLYCVGDEAFIKESDLIDGKCPHHPNMELIQVEEENYFFKLSAYQEKITEYLSRKETVIPDWRRVEALAFTQRGLEDFSISREKARMSWGIPVPGDDTQVMYVWFDALTSYISTLGWPNDPEGNFKKFWHEGEAIQMAGKDQVRFQSIMWQAMLMSAGVKGTDTVVYHGFITSGGQKMSKSLGNVIDPLKIVEEYGIDALRFFLARHVSSFEDSDFTMERFKETYNADLANGIGNLASRIMKMASTHLSQAPQIPENTIPEEFKTHLESFEVQKATHLISEAVQHLDEHIQETEPFKLVKRDKEKAIKIIEELVIKLYTIARMLRPVLPETSEKIKVAIKNNVMPEILFPRKE